MKTAGAPCGAPAVFLPFAVPGRSLWLRAAVSGAVAARPMKNLQIRLTRLPNGTISPGDLTLVETETPPTGKGQMLCRTRWLSLEPLHGCNARDVRPGEVLPAQAVCEVVESRNEVFNAGDIVVMETGLQNYRVSDGVQVHRVRTGSAPLSAALGIMGEPGLTASKSGKNRGVEGKRNGDIEYGK
jgi:NADPH-dependent curcumin reductase CurA